MSDAWRSDQHRQQLEDAAWLRRGSANTIRLTLLTYSGGRELNYDYGTTDGPGDLLSRVGSLIDDDRSTHLADYTYLGLGGVVEVSSPQPGTKLTYISAGTGDGGDQYTGWDRFGRVTTSAG